MTSMNIYSKLCRICGHDCSGQERSVPCPRCGGVNFQLVFSAPMTITSRGPATVTVPAYSPHSTQTTIETEGNVDVSLGGAGDIYSFAHFTGIKRKSGRNWAHLKLRRDGKGLDVIFGGRPGGEHHSHYSYTAMPKMIYLRREGDTQLVRKLAFDSRDGVFVPMWDRIDDKATGMSAVLEFALRNGEVVVTDVRFLPTAT